jgi:type II secretion system protein H
LGTLKPSQLHLGGQLFGSQLGRQLGFTLLEILLVVLVVGMGLAIAVPRLMPDKKAEANRAAQTIFAALERARDEAVFSGTTIAVQFSTNTLRYQERDASNTNTWIASSRAGLSDVALPDSLTEIEISNMGESSDNTAQPSTSNQLPQLPRLIFQPAGYGAPATVTLKFMTDLHHIVISPIGAIVLNPRLNSATKVVENAR